MTNFLVHQVFGPIFQAIYGWIGSYGISIIVFTVLIKILLLPLTIPQLNSMKMMKELQPKIAELQEKYKNNKEKLNAELLNLYKEHKYNPASGCLPLIIQLPIIYALFYLFQKYPGFQGASFLWVNNLAAPDKTYILPVISAVTTYLSTIMVPSSKDQSQNMTYLMLSAFTLWISLKFPAGLVLYWTVGNLFQIIQQFIMLRPVLFVKGESKR